MDVLLKEPDGPVFPTVEGHELIQILGIAHRVEGRSGAGQPTPATDLVGGRVEVARSFGEVLPGLRVNGIPPPIRQSPEPRPHKRDCTLTAAGP